MSVLDKMSKTPLLINTSIIPFVLAGLSIILFLISKINFVWVDNSLCPYRSTLLIDAYINS